MEWCCWHVAVVDSGEALAIIVAILPPESSCVIQAIHFKHTLRVLCRVTATTRLFAVLFGKEPLLIRAVDQPSVRQTELAISWLPQH